MWFCCLVILLFCDLVILLFCDLVVLLFCDLVILLNANTDNEPTNLVLKNSNEPEYCSKCNNIAFTLQ